MNKIFFLILLMGLISSSLFSQNENLIADSCIKEYSKYLTITKINDKVVSKEVNTKLFHYSAKYNYQSSNSIEAELFLASFFDTLDWHADSNLRANLIIEIPQYRFNVDHLYGYSSGFMCKYKGENILIYRDCGCGYFNRRRASGGRFNGVNNQLFDRKVRFRMSYRNYYKKNEFNFFIDKGLPTVYETFNDSNKLEKKIVFKNGLIDSLQAFYPNGNLMYEASLKEGELNGDFVYYDSYGNESLRVNFVDSEIYYFLYSGNHYEYSELLHMWFPIHIPCNGY